MGPCYPERAWCLEPVFRTCRKMGRSPRRRSLYKKPYTLPRKLSRYETAERFASSPQLAGGAVTILKAFHLFCRTMHHVALFRRPPLGGAISVSRVGP